MDCVPYAEVATEKNDEDANASLFPVSSGFTAINHPLTQLLTPESSAVATSRPCQTSSRAIGNKRRRRNPDVALYLGLGSTTEPAHLQRYAPRSKQADGHTMRCSPASLTPCSPQHPRVAHDFNTSAPIMDDLLLMSHPVYPEDLPCVTPRSIVGSATVPTISQDAVEAPHAEDFHFPVLSPGDDTVLGTSPDTSGELIGRDNNDTTTNDDDFDFDITDDGPIALTSSSCVGVPHSVSYSPAEFHNSNNDKGHAIDDYHGNACSEAPPIGVSQHARKKFVTPVTPATRLLAANGEEGTTRAQKPIVRPPFPKPVRDRSPIIGLSATVVLRTCFRIGEAINQSHKASKSGQQMMIELYARVLASERTETQQYFTFCDLFHVRPPYIKGAYDAAMWKAVPLFEYDSQRLLEQGRICRCIGTIKHNSRERIMVIHNIWEATWEDIEWAEGVVCS